MRFYVFLLAHFIFFILSIGLTYLGHVILNDLPTTLIGCLGITTFFWMILTVLRNYRRFELTNDLLTIRTITGNTIAFDLRHITKWEEIENVYRVRTRKLKVSDEMKEDFINDWIEYRKYEDVYHYFRTHLRDKNELYA